MLIKAFQYHKRLIKNWRQSDKAKAKNLYIERNTIQVVENKGRFNLPAVHAAVKFSLPLSWAITDNRHPCLQASKGSS